MSYQRYFPKYKYLIYKIFGQYANQYNHDDMEQAAHLGFLKALKTYDKKKSQLQTWIYINVRKECQTQKNMEYITTCCSETRTKCKPEEKYPYENCNIEYKPTTRTGEELLNSFFERYPELKYKKLFTEKYLLEKTKEELEVRYRMNRKQLNEVLEEMTNLFKNWYKEEEYAS